MSKFWPLIKLLPIRTNFQFVKYARLFGSLSILLVIGSIFFTVYPADNKCGGLTCGVDFLGGNLIEMSTRPEPVDHDVDDQPSERDDQPGQGHAEGGPWFGDPVHPDRGGRRGGFG